MFWTCFEVMFLEKKCPMHPKGPDLEKFKKKLIKFQFFKNVQKRSQECSNILRGDFFEIIMPCRVEKWEKNEEKIEVLKFQNCPKTFLKVSKQVLNLFWGNFLRKKVPSAPRTVETWKNFKKLEKLAHFQNAQKRSQKQSNMFRTCFEEIFSVKLLLSAPWGFERREDGKYGKFQYF